MALLSTALSVNIGPRELSFFPCSIAIVLCFYLPPCEVGVAPLFRGKDYFWLAQEAMQIKSPKEFYCSHNCCIPKKR